MAFTKHGGKMHVLSERLATLCKVYREGEDVHFAQFMVQTGEVGEAIIKGFESPKLTHKERRELHKCISDLVYNDFGYSYGKYNRKKAKGFHTRRR